MGGGQFQQAGEFHPIGKRKGEIPPFIFRIQFLDQVVKGGPAEAGVHIQAVLGRKFPLGGVVGNAYGIHRLFQGLKLPGGHQIQGIRFRPGLGIEYTPGSKTAVSGVPHTDPADAVKM